jgi:hypothetical protein
MKMPAMFKNGRTKDGRTKVAPSVYPRIPFHGLRFLQLLSSIIVGSIMSFFMYHLTHDHWRTPWTFVLVSDCADRMR